MVPIFNQKIYYSPQPFIGSTAGLSRVWADIGGLKGDCDDLLRTELITRNGTHSQIQFKELVKKVIFMEIIL